MNTSLKFKKIVKNDKIPLKNESVKDKTTLKSFNEINTKFYNMAIPAMDNNLIILDIDFKDDGVLEWREYCKQYGEPFTVTEKNPNNGLHYYFVHKDSTYSDEHNELINKLKN